MKTNLPHSVTNFAESLVIAALIILIGAITTAKAQNNLPRISNSNSVLNGIFSPTAAERFFEAGREDFAREIEFLTHPEKYLHQDVLQINPELIRQIQENQKPNLTTFDYQKLDNSFQLESEIF